MGRKSTNGAYKRMPIFMRQIKLRLLYYSLLSLIVIYVSFSKTIFNLKYDMQKKKIALLYLIWIKVFKSIFWYLF